MLNESPNPVTTVETTEAAQRAAANRAMDRYAAGDDAAFESVYAFVAPRIRRMLLAKTGDRHRADDLLQQTTLHMHRFRSAFCRGRDVTSWARGIARHLWLDELRVRGREPTTLAVRDDAILRGVPGPESCEMEARELARRLQAVFHALPITQRAAFELLRLEGLSHEEAARRLGVTVPAVKLRAFRACGAMRAALCEEGQAARHRHGEALR